MKKTMTVLIVLTLLGCSDKEPTDHMLAANTSLEKNNPEVAIIALKNAINTSPELAEPRFLLGKTYLSLHQYTNAAKELERAYRYKYNVGDVLPLLAKALQQTQDHITLIELSFNKLTLTADQQAQVTFYQLQALLILDKNQEVEVLSSVISKLDTNSVFKKLSLAYLALTQENFVLVHDYIETILKVEASQPDALLLKARILLNNNQAKEASTIYQQYIDAYPHDITTRFILAKLYIDTQQTSKGEPLVDELLKIHKNNILLNQLKALARAEAKDSEAAVRYAEMAITQTPHDTVSRLIAGIHAYLLNDFEKSYNHLAFIADKLPTNHQALRVLAASQLSLGLNLEANDTVMRFSSENTQDYANDSVLMSNVGLALNTQGETVKAKALLTNNSVTQATIKASKTGNTTTQDTTLAFARLGLLKLSLNDVTGIGLLEASLNQAQTLINKEASNKQNFDDTLSIEKVLANAYLSTGQFDKALALAKKWQVEQPDAVKGFIFAGIVHTRSKQVELAKVSYQKALSITPNYLPAKLALIVLLPQKSNAEKQIILNKLLILGAENPTAISVYEKAYKLSRHMGDITAITQLTQQASTAIPNNYAIMLLRAKIAFDNGEYQQAINGLTNINGTAMKPAMYWKVLGRSYIERREYQKALNTYQQWLTIAPNSKAAMLDNIIMLSSINKVDDALALSQRYTKAHGQNNNISMIETQLLLQNKQFVEAKISYEKLPAQLHNNPLVKGFLGQLQLHQGDSQKALPNLKAAYKQKQSPSHADWLSRALINEKLTNEALAFLKAHTTRNPNDQVNLMSLAWLQASVDKTQAIKTYQKVITINSNHAYAHKNIASLYAEQGIIEQAQNYAERAVKLLPNDVNVLDTLGNVLLKKGDYRKALKTLAKAVGIDPKNTLPEVSLHYIEALLGNKKIELAQRKMKNISLSKAQQIRLNSLKSQYGL